MRQKFTLPSLISQLIHGKRVAPVLAGQRAPSHRLDRSQHPTWLYWPMFVVAGLLVGLVMAVRAEH
jgi:hypothetical protein